MTMIEEGLNTKPVSAQIVDFAENLADRSRDVASRTSVKLTPVMRQLHPPKLEVQDKVPDPVYPPLFHTIREQLEAIEQSLAQIETVLDNVEL